MDVKQLIGSVIETIIKVAVVVFLIMFVYDKAMQAYDYGYRIFAEAPLTVGEGRTISIAVEQDESVKDIGEKLQQRGLIRDANLFFLQELVSENHGQIQPGIYDLNTSMTTEEMITVMAAEPIEIKEESASDDNIPMGEMEDDEGMFDDIFDEMPDDEGAVSDEE